MGERWFPIQKEFPHEKGRYRVPWSVAEKAYKNYAKQFGTSQSLERLAERGGFGLIEFLVLLADADFNGCSCWKSDMWGNFKDE